MMKLLQTFIFIIHAMVKNISNQVELLSTAENLPDEDFINLKLASVFLLTGYISDYEKPMEASLRLVEEILPGYGFSQENVESTKKIIKNSFTDQSGIYYLIIFFMMQDMIIWVGLII